MAKLRSAIQEAIKKALAGSVDRVVRADLPSTWPLAEAIKNLRQEADEGRMRVGILRPFTSKMFTRVDCEMSDDPTRITRWRNDRRKGWDLIVCGRADGQSAAGLRDFARVVRRRDVMAAWVELEGDVAAGKSGKPEVGRLVAAMFEQCGQGRIDALALDDYLTAAAQVTSRHIDSVFGEMWRARLLPDDQVLDQGASARRLDTNLDIVARLEAEEERDVRTRLKKATSGGESRAASARAALAFMKSGAREDLRGARLSDILNILGQRAVPPAAERVKDFTELLDLFAQEPQQCTEALATLSERWNLDDAESAGIEVDVTIGDDRSRYRVVLRPTTEKTVEDDSSHDVVSSPWVGEGGFPQVLIAWRDQETPEGFDSDAAWKRRTAGEFDQVLNAHPATDVGVLREAEVVNDFETPTWRI